MLRHRGSLKSFIIASIISFCVPTLTLALHTMQDDESNYDAPEDDQEDRGSQNNRKDSDTSVSDKNSNAAKDPAGENSKFVWQEPKLKTFTSQQIKDECIRYRDQYIGYYGRIFWVNHCKLYELEDQDLVRRLFLNPNIRVISVESDTIAMIPHGAPLKVLPSESLKERSCKTLNGQYVIYGASDIYFIEACKRRQIPDYETYIEHAKDRKQSQIITELTSSEFYNIIEGVPVASIMPDVAKRLMDREQQVDVIPVSEACLGVDGNFVSYYSKVYLIDKCRKRQVKNLQAFMIKAQKDKLPKLFELTSEQWVSLPDGVPLLEAPSEFELYEDIDTTRPLPKQ